MEDEAAAAAAAEAASQTEKNSLLSSNRSSSIKSGGSGTEDMRGKHISFFQQRRQMEFFTMAKKAFFWNIELGGKKKNGTAGRRMKLGRNRLAGLTK